MLSASRFTPSFNQVLRDLKRQENGLYNCLWSIVSDSLFIQEIAGLYPSLPLCANLRCGLWYVANPDEECYFKSTDGHINAWCFSTVRLNWHLALLAASKGGCLVVDATRRGKTFPVRPPHATHTSLAVIHIIFHRTLWLNCGRASLCFKIYRARQIFPISARVKLEFTFRC